LKDIQNDIRENEISIKNNEQEYIGDIKSNVTNIRRYLDSYVSDRKIIEDIFGSESLAQSRLVFLLGEFEETSIGPLVANLTRDARILHDAMNEMSARTPNGASPTPIGISEFIEDMKDKNNSIIEESNDMELDKDEMRRIEDVIKTNTEFRAKAERRVAEINSQDSMMVTINSSVARLGPVIVAFFFVAVLLSMYRYSVRLSSFFDGRSAAFKLFAAAGSDEHRIAVRDLGYLMETMAPDKIGLGKQIETPTGQLLDILEKASKLSIAKPAG
jgi:hypothetical protein